MADDRHRRYKQQKAAQAKAARDYARGTDITLTGYETLQTWIPWGYPVSSDINRTWVAFAFTVAGAITGYVADGGGLAAVLGGAGFCLVAAVFRPGRKREIVARVRMSQRPNPEFDRKGRRIRDISRGPVGASGSTGVFKEMFPEPGSPEYYLKKISEKD